MAAVVTWTSRAEGQLNTVLSNLYDVSPRQSEKWAAELDHKLALVAQFPEMGRLVPKHGLYFYREILVGYYRVKYVYLTDTVYIVSVRHQAGKEDLGE